MSSKFSYWIILVGLIATIVVGFGITIVYKYEHDVKASTVFNIFFIIWYLFLASFIILGELRTKCIKITLNFDYLERAGFFGFGLNSRYYYSQFEGYSLSDLYSKGKAYEFLYLIKDGKKIVKISEYYHSNYFELKKFIIQKDIVFLGKIKWSFFREFRENFVF